MHICVDKSLEFSYHMFNCNCCEIWWMFFLWTLFVQLNIVVNLLFACRFKMGYFCFNLAIAPHTVQLNECVRSTSESIPQSYWNRRWYTADRKRFAALLRVRTFSGTICDIALSHTRTGSKPCPMQNTIPGVIFSGNVWDPKRKAHVTLAATVGDTQQITNGLQHLYVCKGAPEPFVIEHYRRQ